MTIYKPKEMAKKLNVTVRTLQRWDNEGKLPALFLSRIKTDLYDLALIGLIAFAMSITPKL